ncbi:hypothetical protein [Bacillus sp. 2205SS5-2]|uniref:hypothetical protein n=1 Tax=Bacillus sp. 2205SS5-2 TaxID=3109031 RepID=UPI003006839D
MKHIEKHNDEIDARLKSLPLQSLSTEKKQLMDAQLQNTVVSYDGLSLKKRLVRRFAFSLLSLILLSFLLFAVYASFYHLSIFKEGNEQIFLVKRNVPNIDKGEIVKIIDTPHERTLVQDILERQRWSNNNGLVIGMDFIMNEYEISIHQNQTLSIYRYQASQEKVARLYGEEARQFYYLITGGALEAEVGLY